MATYYLLKGKQIIGTVERAKGDVTALPLLSGKDAMSLVSADEVLTDDVASAKGLATKLAYLGLVDKRVVQAGTTKASP